jgi:ABC-type nitrate/sulfonate/bicarbonate transport system permease component
MPEMSKRIRWIKILTILTLGLSWELLAHSGLLFEGVVPSINPMVQAIVAELRDPSFYRDLGITMFASFMGFLIGSIIAIALGLVLGIKPFVRGMIEPFITAIGGTPKIIFLPILFLVFGLGIESKIAKSALSTFFPVVLSTTIGFIQIPAILLRVGHSFYLSRWQMTTKIYMPAMSNALLTGVRLGMAMAIIGVLTAEISFSDSGLGYRLIRNADQFKISSVYALVILIFSIAATINWGLTKLQDHCNRHERGRHGDDSKLRTLATMSHS